MSFIQNGNFQNQLQHNSWSPQKYYTIKPKWSYETNVPTDRFSVPIAINSSEFLITPYHSHYWQTNGLYKYNVLTKTWSEWVSYNFKTSFHTSAYDNINNLLYIYNKEALLIIINLTSSQFEIHQVKSYGKYASSVVINGIFHLIGGFKSNKHLIWNKSLNCFHEICHFKEYSRGFYLHKLCYIKTKNLLLLMGGYYSTSRTQRSSNSIYYYKINQNKHIWIKLNVTLPRRMYSFGFILTRNEKYIIIFGGNDTNHIHIFILKELKIVQTNLLCPKNGGFHAVTLDNWLNDKIIVIAFIRDTYKLLQFKDVQFIPKPLCALIHKYFSNEIIHLIQQFKKEHWKINTYDILDYYFKSIK